MVIGSSLELKTPEEFVNECGIMEFSSAQIIEFLSWESQRPGDPVDPKYFWLQKLSDLIDTTAGTPEGRDYLYNLKRSFGINGPKVVADASSGGINILTHPEDGVIGFVQHNPIVDDYFHRQGFDCVHEMSYFVDINHSGRGLGTIMVSNEMERMLNNFALAGINGLIIFRVDQNNRHSISLAGRVQKNLSDLSSKEERIILSRISSCQRNPELLKALRSDGGEFIFCFQGHFRS